MRDKKSLPELLSPAGSPAALEAAIEGGADAVYFGGSGFNARMFAENFDGDILRDAIKTAHAYGVKCYITLNTLVTDRELGEALRTAAGYYDAGADALIVADQGLAAAIHREIPGMELHASTQASGHNLDAARQLAGLGFSRMVMAREASLCDIKTFTEKSGLELEVFVHGALCVCHSGQCLFSSMVGGRSGNRGECAQPCRLPYNVRGKQGYPLSLKDLCLAAYVPELIDAGVSSLKIEGRMKPPEYVLAVTRVWRRLLDEGRSATKEELEYLASVFSRGGSFTDGYFAGRIGHSMLGVRTEDDKNSTRSLAPFDGLTRKVQLDIKAEFRKDIPSLLTLSDGKRSVTVAGDMPFEAKTAPMTEEGYLKSLAKFGGTPYSVGKAEIRCDAGLMMPLSRLNSLRRAGLEALSHCGERQNKADVSGYSVPSLKEERVNEKTARFLSPERITAAAREYFDRIYLPLDRFDGSTDAVIMPSVLFDREAESVRKLLSEAVSEGAKHILVGNIGHIGLAREFGLEVHGDWRLNIQNSEALLTMNKLGFEDVMLSPELSLPRQRDIKGKSSTLVYGRIPLMVLEKCLIRELVPCPGMHGSQICTATLTDRKGIDFPVVREYPHRSVIYNSLPTNMSDRKEELLRAGIRSWHFIFSTESAYEVDAVIKAFRDGLVLPLKVRRI